MRLDSSIIPSSAENITFMPILKSMKVARYELKSGKSLTTFEFLSEGPKGQITKLLQFQQMNLPNLYNLAFGDLNPLTGQLDDKVITDNDDGKKV